MVVIKSIFNKTCYQKSFFKIPQNPQKNQYIGSLVQSCPDPF